MTLIFELGGMTYKDTLTLSKFKVFFFEQFLYEFPNNLNLQHYPLNYTSDFK